MGKIFGPKARSVHLTLEGLVQGNEVDGRFIPSEDASAFPVRAVQLILNEAIALTSKRLSRTSKTPPGADASEAALEKISENIAAVQELLWVLGKWQRHLSDLDPIELLGPKLGLLFEDDLKAMKATFQAAGLRFRLGGGTTTTGAAALRAYFDMYSESRESYEAIPQQVKDEIESTKLRTAYSGNMTHQVGGFGCDIQAEGMWTNNLNLLFQAATDEAVGFEWRDVGVLQYWISPENLAIRNWNAVQVKGAAH